MRYGKPAKARILRTSKLVLGVRIGAVDGASYYSRRSARDLDWRERQIQDAKECERRRFASDPDGVRERRNATARGWYTRLRETDPERFQELRAEKTERDRRRRASLTEEERAAVRAADVERKHRRRTHTPVSARGLTFEELSGRIPNFGRETRSALAYVLADEVRSGRVELHAGRYSVNGGLDAETRRALLDLGRVDDRR